MQRVDDQPAFVLHAQPYRETSLLIEVLSRDHGRVGVLARGLRSARSQALRAALQPLQPLLLSWSGPGELVRLVRGDAAGASLSPQRDALLAAFYLNELLVRLLPRGEPHARVFFRYIECLGALQAGDDIAWQLRRFERDLLGDLGYALALEYESDGVVPIDPARHYRWDPESGAHPLSARGNGSVSGAALLAWGCDRHPGPEGLRELRGVARRVLRQHLGGRELRSWQLLAELAARPGLRGPVQSGDAASS